MDKASELDLFDYLARQPKLRQWLNSRLEAEVSALIQSVDIDQLRRAQGRAGLLKQMLDLMDKAPAALEKR